MKLVAIEKENTSLSFEVEGIEQLEELVCNQVAHFRGFYAISSLFFLCAVRNFSLWKYIKEQKNYTVFSTISNNFVYRKW
jgi:hypothetical protein